MTVTALPYFRLGRQLQFDTASELNNLCNHRTAIWLRLQGVAVRHQCVW